MRGKSPVGVNICHSLSPLKVYLSLPPTLSPRTLTKSQRESDVCFCPSCSSSCLHPPNKILTSLTGNPNKYFTCWTLTWSTMFETQSWFEIKIWISFHISLILQMKWKPCWDQTILTAQVIITSSLEWGRLHFCLPSSCSSISNGSMLM